MKIAIVKSSELGNRWDVGFHLLRQKHKRDVERMEGKISAQYAIEMLSEFPFQFLEPLSPLSRRNSVTERGSFKRDDALAIIQEYPLLSLAIVTAEHERIAKKEDDRIQAMMNHLEKTRAVARHVAEVTNAVLSPFKPFVSDPDAKAEEPDHHIETERENERILPDHLYRLTEIGTYDDETNTGFDYVRLPPGETGETPTGVAFRILDMWICNKDGDVHPGYDESPVPVLRDSIDLSTGSPVAMENRKRGTLIWR